MLYVCRGEAVTEVFCIVATCAKYHCMDPFVSLCLRSSVGMCEGIGGVSVSGCGGGGAGAAAV